MVRFRVLLAVSALTFTGCFNYIPVELSTVPDGDNLRVAVTRRALADLEEISLDAVSSLSIKGRLVRREDDGLFLRVPIGMRQEGFHSAPLGQDVRIPTAEILGIEQRRFDRVGTAALVVGTIGAGATVVLYIMKAFGENEEDGECNDCLESRLPIFSFPLPFR